MSIFVTLKVNINFQSFLVKDDWPLDTKISKNERSIIWHRNGLSLLSSVEN